MPYQSFGKVLMLLGLLIVLIGAFVYLVPRFPFLEKLPLNFKWQKGPVTVYFPLGLSIVGSVILTVVLSILGKK